MFFFSQIGKEDWRKHWAD